MNLSFENINVEPARSLSNRDVDVHVLRLDKLHPVVSGNKWFKLRYYLEDALNQGKKRIVTFGGAFSNHVVATAAACRMNGLQSAAVIRGEEPRFYSHTLKEAGNFGMRLFFSSRADFSEKSLPAEVLTDEDYVISEGGYGELGAAGASRILDYVSQPFSHYCCAVGTGTMMAGIINAAGGAQRVIGISVMKGNFELADRVRSLARSGAPQWEINHDYHFGGYAKKRDKLIAFMNDFFRHSRIPSDFVYTGKLFFAADDLLKQAYFPPGSRVLLIHSGGLQGNLSLEKGTLIF